MQEEEKMNAWCAVLTSPSVPLYAFAQTYACVGYIWAVAVDANVPSVNAHSSTNGAIYVGFVVNSTIFVPMLGVRLTYALVVTGTMEMKCTRRALDDGCVKFDAQKMN